MYFKGGIKNGRIAEKYRIKYACWRCFGFVNNDAKTKITVWKSETEKLFEGKVYQLYDKTDFNNMYISYLRFDCMAGINVIITEKWK